MVVHVEDRWLLVGNMNGTRASSVFLEVSLHLLIRGHIFITSNMGGGRWDSFNLWFDFLFFPLHKLVLILVLEIPASDPVLGIEVGHGGRCSSFLKSQIFFLDTRGDSSFTSLQTIAGREIGGRCRCPRERC